MDVILLERIRNLGDLGDMVSVKSGYARNYLVPFKKAVIANEENRANFEARRAELEKAQAESLAKAQARADALNGQTITIKGNAGEEGRLFGSIGTRDIAEALVARGLEVAKVEVQLPEGPIKSTGTREVQINLHPEVQATITVAVEAE